MRDKVLLLIGAVILAFFLLLGCYFFLIKIGGNETKLWIDNSWQIIRQTLVNNGPLLFLAIAILPGLVLPVAPLLGLAGLWGGENGPWLSCFYCTIALFVNLSWTYWLAKGPARGILQRFLSKSRLKLPESPPKNMLEWALILRLTLYPLFLQIMVLGLSA